ncbi:MAG: threonine/serine dehydratase [Rhodospirillales bacterium]
MNKSLSELDTSPLGLDAVRDAATAMQDIVVRTPLLENPDANDFLGGRLLIKAEHMQRTGAFKIRGAYNRLRSMTEAEKDRGTITYSSGNHAQGLALAARLTGTSAMIVMPDDTPVQKIESTKALGATVVHFNRDRDDINEVLDRLRNETGRVIVPPSGDTRIHAGAATAALELCEQAHGIGADLDAVLVPCGGGGLTAATAIVMNALAQKARVYAVEPELFDDTRRSLAIGARQKNPKGQRTICDAIMTPTPNEQTFEINRRLLAGGLVASDGDACRAMKFAFDYYKSVIEPGAAVGIAAVLNGEIDIRGKTVAVFTTGGNIDPGRYFELLNSASGDKDR